MSIMMLRRALVRQRPLILRRAAPRCLPTNNFNPILFLASTENNSTNNSTNSCNDPTNLPFQVRWKRNDGHSAFTEPRKTTRKQKKTYRKRQREIYHERVGKHSAPNSKASIRRQFDEETRQDLLNRNKVDEDTPELEYDYGDALLDDLMGNSAELTSTSTPEPIYLGDKHLVYYNRVADQMARYKQAMESVDEEMSTTAVISMEGLPTDHAISMVVRSYRDRNGKRLKPVGVAKVLEHLLKDLQLPISTFGEETFTSILTCCSTPKEARRMFRLMQDLAHPITAYSWSILVDIHAKLGDFQGCDSVLREMVIVGITPTLPAYTSLLAACHKVVNAGHIPHSIRAQAGKLGWSKWKEMRIIGIEPDAMAYGAMLRLCAARGRAEQSLNVLEEMQTFGVKPTTLCFSSALKAVARSHQIAIRFENGASPMYRKRQEVAAYHGKLTRQVVILAESAEVEQDEGFIAALMLCAGASGDSATAKAILLASEIRKMDHLRTIGSDSHLKRLYGYNDSQDEDPLSIDAKLSQLFLNGDTSAAEAMMEESMKEIAFTGDGSMPMEVKKAPVKMTYGEREYGSDSRVLSALMQACSQAVDSNGIGSLWEGRDNRGYLCDDSLRMLTVKPEPKMMDNSIPGVSSTTVGVGSLTYDEEDPDTMSKRLRRAKFQGIDMDDESGTNMDDLDPYFYDMFKDDDPILNRVNPDSVQEVLPQDDPAWDLGSRQVLPELDAQETSVQPKEEWFFDIDDRKWKSRMTSQSTGKATGDTNVNIESNELFDSDFGLEQGEEEQNPLEGTSQLYFDANEGKIYDSNDQTRRQATTSEHKEEWYFDQSESKWKMRLLDASNAAKMVQPALTEYEASSLTHEEQQSLISYPNLTDDYHDTGGMLERPKPGFEEFVNMLKEEKGDSDHTVDFSGAEVKELYDMMGNDSVDPQGLELPVQKHFGALETSASEYYAEGSFPQTTSSTSSLDEEQQHLMEMMKSMGMDVSINDEDIDKYQGDDISELMQQDDVKEAISALNQLSGTTPSSLQETPNDDIVEMMPDDSLTTSAFDEQADYMLEELTAALPGMPEHRVRRVRDAFQKTLGYPSLLTLAPLLRENMPERVTLEWLKRKNIQNAYFVVEKAKEDGLLDVHTINGMLQVETSTGSIDRALACHEARFMQHGFEPTEYSDRLVLQMLVKNHRLSRALQFKDRVEVSGRNLDVLSYGTLISHYAKHRQIGSAVMMLKECVDVHDSAPNEHSLNALRRLCRHQHLTDQVGLVELAGEDPSEWLRDGESNLKREYSKKGRRSVLLPRNKSVHI